MDEVQATLHLVDNHLDERKQRQNCKGLYEAPLKVEVADDPGTVLEKGVVVPIILVILIIIMLWVHWLQELGVESINIGGSLLLLRSAS